MKHPQKGHRPLRLVGDLETTEHHEALSDIAASHGREVVAVDTYPADEVLERLMSDSLRHAALRGHDLWVPHVSDLGGLTRGSAAALVAGIVGVACVFGGHLRTPQALAVEVGMIELPAVLQGTSEILGDLLCNAAAPGLLRAIGDSISRTVVDPQEQWDSVLEAAVDGGVAFEGLPRLLRAVASAVPEIAAPPGAAEIYFRLDAMTRPSTHQTSVVPAA